MTNMEIYKIPTISEFDKMQLLTNQLTQGNKSICFFPIVFSFSTVGVSKSNFMANSNKQIPEDWTLNTIRHILEFLEIHIFIFTKSLK